MGTLILDEELFLEGKNLQKTLDQYRDKFKKSYDPFETSDDEADRLMMSVISSDPTYQDGATTTGDFGIWLLNQELKDNITRFESSKDMSIRDLLADFIEKKANLANKDINSYKTPDQLYDILKATPLSDRQKERKLRKDISGAKHVGSTSNFDIYIPETYEAACALGKGSGWCTADSRTRKYYDYYKDEYGGDYYIIISKDGKYKYQVHFESDQYSAAGSNPDIDTPNEEVMLSFDELTSQWPELKDYFEDKVPQYSARQFLMSVLDELGIDEVYFRVQYQKISNLLLSNRQKFDWWFSQDGENIPSIRVFQSLTANKDAFHQFNSVVDQRDKNHIIPIEDLQDLVYDTFLYKFPKRLVSLKLDAERLYDMRYLSFASSSVYPDRMVFKCSQDALISRLNNAFPSDIHEFVVKKDLEGLTEFLSTLLPYDESEFQSTILELFQQEIIIDAGKLPSVTKAYFDSDTVRMFFFEEFEWLLMDAVDEARGI